MKPFDIVAAQRGVPVQTYSGLPARILCFDKSGDAAPIVALVNIHGSELLTKHRSDGSEYNGDASFGLWMTEVVEPDMHVDDFIDFGTSFSNPKANEKMARWFLFLHRLPAHLQIDFKSKMEGLKLFCDFEGRRYRCIGASRMGDVWLTSNILQDATYEKRVDVIKCTNWDDKP